MLVATVCVFASASVAGASLNGGGPGGNGLHNGRSGELKSYVSPDLLSAIQQNPKQQFDVILQGNRGTTAHGFVQRILASKSGSSDENVGSSDVKREFTSVDGAQLTLSGKQILRLAKVGLAQSIVANETAHAQGPALPLSNKQLWPWATGAPVDWLRGSPDAGTIAVIDSGIQASRPDFTGRVVGEFNFENSLPNNSAGDGYGHGTFVAGIAAGGAPGFAGAAPKADILSLDVMNDQGQATVGDILKACDFVLANKTKYNIKVVNMSLHAVSRASVLFDPLDQAVEKLWLNGIVVVAAAGNYGNGTPVGVQFAPGNDPFVITVGAADIGTSLGAGDDTAAPWSAYGYTPDGFWKPEIAAPGRYMVGPVPAGSGLTQAKPQNVTDPVAGYMQLSGTSFAAPVVSAAAAMLMAQHPTWTPDQVKGALMVTASPEPKAGKALGVGDVNIASARMWRKPPPNPNAGLEQYLTTAADGSKMFDAKAWQAAALSNKAWNAAAWADVAWSDAAWSSVAWSDAAWADAAWASSAYGTVAWSDVAWSDAAWSDAAWADNAGDAGVSDDTATSAEQDATLADLGIVDASCDPSITLCTAADSATGTVTTTVNGLLP
ncbi:MAG TPA: S8 family serine peptidase [Gaiellaceae bacterium]|nr:S8 family serine peptidase [Gaiellaceae bacterium]